MTPHVSSKTIEEWLTYLLQQGKSAHTISAYSRALSHFAHWYRQAYGDEVKPSGVIPRDIRDWKSCQQTVEKAAPGTINQRLVALSRFFAWAVAEEFIQIDPTVNIRTLHQAQRQPKALDQQIFRRLLRAVHNSG